MHAKQYTRCRTVLLNQFPCNYTTDKRQVRPETRKAEIGTKRLVFIDCRTTDFVTSMNYKQTKNYAQQIDANVDF